MPGLVLPELAEILELLPPAGAALVLFVFGAALSRRGAPGWVTIGAVLAVGVAFAWTFIRLRGAPAFPPRLSTERGLWAVLIASTFALGGALSRAEAWVRLVPSVVAAPIVVVWVAGGLASEAMPSGRLAAAALGATAYLVLLDRASACPGPLFGFVTAVALGATGQVLLMFRSALLAQLAGALALAMALIALASLFFRRPLPPAITVPLGAVTIAVSLDAALFSYERIPTLSLVLLASAPLGPLVLFGGVSDRRNALARSLAAAVLSLAVTGIAFYLAWRVAPPAFR